jgi:hypothetical protein
MLQGFPAHAVHFEDFGHWPPAPAAASAPRERTGEEEEYVFV